MTEKKRGAAGPFPNLSVRATPIAVARNRAVEPYVKTFSFSPDNVTQEGLGTLVGAFSVSDRSESSAYTVNVIASVARKEYFANPRRGAIESFESTLHRINLALSELVKNGQTSWMGELHGAIAVVEKHNLHFSATGSGRILLFRDGSVADIGEGLASEEAATHPLKTFLEISSGRLSAGDCILLSTPELFELFSTRELERNANRLLPDDRFARFLETAMINELRQGAAIALDVREESASEPAREKQDRPKRKRQQKPETVNAWSEKVFREAEEKRTQAILEAYDPERDIAPGAESDDSTVPPTGEIRIQGEMPVLADEHPFITRLRWMTEDALRAGRVFFDRSVRETWRRSADVATSLASGMTSVTKAPRTPRAPRSVPDPEKTLPVSRERQSEPRLTSIFPSQTPDAGTQTAPNAPRTIPPRHAASRDWKHETGRLFRQGRDIATVAGARCLMYCEKTAIPATRTAARHLGRKSAKLLRASLRLAQAGYQRFLALPPKRQLMIGAGAAFAVTVLVVASWNRPPEQAPTPAPVTESVPTPAPSFPPKDEPLAKIADIRPLTDPGSEIVAPVYLDNTLYVVTRSGITNPANGTASAAPEGERIRLAASMQDLGLIFFLTDEGSLYSYAPSNRSFAKNAIAFPDGFRPAAMGDFLTYLYFLGEGTGTVYRFPRADGGFGEGTPWTRSSLPSGTRSIAVSENIYATDGASLLSLLRGRPADGFATPATKAPVMPTAICANSDVADRLVILDAATKRLVVTDAAGTLRSQYFDESFTSATACALSGDGSTVAVSSSSQVYTVRFDD